MPVQTRRQLATDPENVEEGTDVEDHCSQFARLDAVRICCPRQHTTRRVRCDPDHPENVYLKGKLCRLKQAPELGTYELSTPDVYKAFLKDNIQFQTLVELHKVHKLLSRVLRNIIMYFARDIQRDLFSIPMTYGNPSSGTIIKQHEGKDDLARFYMNQTCDKLDIDLVPVNELTVDEFDKNMTLRCVT
ncbi:hypothetical protein Tco_0020349 [Tanacetum coccineum]